MQQQKSGPGAGFALPSDKNGAAGAVQARYVGLVGCGKAKLNTPAPARELYTGSLTKMAIQWMERNSAKWYILSAKYGLLHPDRVVVPYDVKLSDYTEQQRIRWGKYVHKQLVDEGLEGLPLMSLAGADYVDAIKIPNECTLLQVCRGMKMGHRMQWLKQHPILTKRTVRELRGEETPVKGGMNFDDMPIGCKSHFLDSGSFTLWTKAIEWGKEHPGRGEEGYYDTKEFCRYVDNYAQFIIKNKVAIDLYSNVDAITHPEITWRTQQYLEEQWGLEPVPVVHYKSDLKWLKHYIKLGYPMISLGGLVGSTTQEECIEWVDRAFKIACPSPDKLPVVKIHGFGITSYRLLLRYPWWSVDSSSWTKVGAFGGILVPHKRKGQFIFTEPPYMMKVAADSPDAKVRAKHLETMADAEKVIIKKWLKEIGVPLGKNNKDGEPLEWGVINRHCERKAANLYFFERMRKALPKWPWPFRVKIQKRLVEFAQVTREELLAKQRK